MVYIYVGNFPERINFSGKFEQLMDRNSVARGGMEAKFSPLESASHYKECPQVGPGGTSSSNGRVGYA